MTKPSNELFIDIETRSSVDLKKAGVYRYVQSPDFDIQLISYAFNDDPVVTLDLTRGDTLPPDLMDGLSGESTRKHAWNCAFERVCFTEWFRRLPCGHRLHGYVPVIEQWFDDMVLAVVCGLPASLDGAGTALGLPEDKAKDKRGKQLVNWFSKPCKPTKKNPDQHWHDPADHPDKWAEYSEYNAQDVVAEREIHRILEHWTPGELEHKAWCMDQRINDRGIRVDMTLAREAVAMNDRYKADLTERAIALTGMQNPKSVSQIKAWLLEQEGVEVPSLNKKEIAGVVAQLASDTSKEFMAIRAELSKSSTAKYKAMLDSACDEHCRGMFQFYGAGRTGRWAGRRVQLQNLSKNKMSDIDACRSLVRAGDYDGMMLLYDGVTSALSELVRTAFIPEDGDRFIVCDYSAIEARTLSWIAREEWALEEFRGDGLIYEATGARMFGVPKHSIAKGGENNHLRQPAKTAELACGYGGGMGAMKAFGADKMGMSDEEIVRAVDLWREAHPNVCALWKSLERAAIRCVVKGTPQISSVGRILFTMENGVLWMRLPSGRRISYFGARYGEGTGKFTRGKKVLSYMGLDQKTHKWTRIETFSGKLTENLVQATARDCLRDAMLALTAAGFRIVAHIHDEVIVSEPRDGRTLEDVAAIMGRELSWAPGLPLRGDGYYCDYYVKD